MTSTGWYPLTVNTERSGQSDNFSIDLTAAIVAFFLAIPTVNIIIIIWFVLVPEQGA